eukprot:SAG11_NODE_17275_length_523_cov_0.948113_1_plen_59_part_01
MMLLLLPCVRGGNRARLPPVDQVESLLDRDEPQTALDKAPRANFTPIVSAFWTDIASNI